ncbi:TRAP transporter small permease [Loktanella sp. IMCC34160]|uniref:TRAP transporter small permease n=1 Tax=Loktanella sp. IMCC34160 TaxID=2510646 RepID=UPI0013EC7F07|nr:TRAP transporter small permease [Loktanella sp. IMCC34160]
MRKRFKSGPPENGGLEIGPILDWSVGIGAATILFCLVLITCVDVVGRYILDTPLTGAFELTEVLLAALVFLALPLATERREHVEVDLLGLLGPRWNTLFSAFAGLFSAALLATFSWRLASHAWKAAQDGSVTNALEIPLAPFGYLASLSCLFCAFIAFLRGIQPPAHERRAKTEEGIL